MYIDVYFSYYINNTSSFLSMCNFNLFYFFWSKANYSHSNHSNISIIFGRLRVHNKIGKWRGNRESVLIWQPLSHRSLQTEKYLFLNFPLYFIKLYDVYIWLLQLRCNNRNDRKYTEIDFWLHEYPILLLNICINNVIFCINIIKYELFVLDRASVGLQACTFVLFSFSINKNNESNREWRLTLIS